MKELYIIKWNRLLMVKLLDTNAIFVRVTTGSHNSQHCLMTVIEKWREIVDNGEAFNVLLANLSKARSNRSLVFYIKDTLKAFDDFKHRQQKCMK